MPVVLETYQAAVDQSGATSFSITKPTGVANGDVILFWASQDDEGQTLTGPSGFTELANTSSPASRDMSVWLGYKVVTNAGSEPASYTITSSISQEWSGFCARISGVDTTTPIDVATPTPVASTATSVDSPEVTTVTDGALVVRLLAATDNNVAAPDQTITAPSSPSGASSYVGATISSPGDQLVAAQWFNLATAGASGTDAWTTTISGALAFVATVAFRPGSSSSNATATPSAIAATASVPAPTVSTTGASTVDVWLLAGAVSGGAFTNSGQEACATTMEGMGYNVTRVDASTLTTQPTTSDCDVVVHITGSVGGTTTLRATVANAAPIVQLNSYYIQNASTGMALFSGAGGTTRSDDNLWITNVANISWTDGYAVNARPVIAPFTIYMEDLSGAVSGGFGWATDNVGGGFVGWGFPAGVTNLAGATTTARTAVWTIFDNIQYLNTAGLQILEDIITWVTNGAAPPTNPSPGTVAATTTVRSVTIGGDATSGGGGGGGPYNIALVVSASGSPHTADTHIRDNLIANGHTVTYVTYTTYVDKDDGYDLVVMSPRANIDFYPTIYHVDQTNTCPLLDLSINAYTQWVMHWADAHAPNGKRIAFDYIEQTRVWVHDDDHLQWGQGTGAIQVFPSVRAWSFESLESNITAPVYHKFMGIPNVGNTAPRTDATYTSDEFVVGFWVEAGDTIVQPNAVYANYTNHTALENYVYCAFFATSTDMWDTDVLNAAGDTLLEALVNLAVTGTSATVVNATATPGVLAATSALPSPTVSVVSNATGTSGTLAATTTVPAPTVTASATRTSTTLAATTTVPAPTVSVSRTAASTTLAATTTLPAPTVQASRTSTPGTLAATTSVPQPRATVVREQLTPWVDFESGVAYGAYKGAINTLLGNNRFELRTRFRPDAMATGSFQVIAAPGGGVIHLRLETTTKRLNMVTRNAANTTWGATQTPDALLADWAGEDITVRVVWDAGAVDFYFSDDDGQTWDLVHSAAAGITDLYNVSMNFTVASYSTTPSWPLSGRVYWAELRDPATSEVLYRFDAAGVPESLASWVDNQGNTWTTSGTLAWINGPHDVPTISATSTVPSPSPVSSTTRVATTVTATTTVPAPSVSVSQIGPGATLPAVVSIPSPTVRSRVEGGEAWFESTSSVGWSHRTVYQDGDNLQSFRVEAKIRPTHWPLSTDTPTIASIVDRRLTGGTSDWSWQIRIEPNYRLAIVLQEPVSLIWRSIVWTPSVQPLDNKDFTFALVMDQASGNSYWYLSPDEGETWTLDATIYSAALQAGLVPPASTKDIQFGYNQSWAPSIGRIYWVKYLSQDGSETIAEYNAADAQDRTTWIGTDDRQYATAGYEFSWNHHFPVGVATVGATCSVPTPSVGASGALVAGSLAATTSVQAPSVTASGTAPAGSLACSISVPSPTVTASGTAAPATLAATTTLPTPGVAGAAYLSTLALTSAVNAPVVTATAGVASSTVAASTSIGSTTQAASGVASPSTVALSTTVPTPGALAQDSPFAGTISSISAVLVPTITATATAAAGTVAAIGTAPTPLSMASALVSPGSIGATVSVPAPAVTATADVTSSVISAASTVGSAGVLNQDSPANDTLTATTSVSAPTVSASGLAGATTVAASAQVPVPTAQALTPAPSTTLSATSSVESPSVTASATLPAGVVSAVVTIPVSGLVATGQPTPATIGSTSTVPQPTVTSTGTASPVVVAGSVAVGPVSVRADAAADSSLIAVTASIGEPSVVSEPDTSAGTISVGPVVQSPGVTTDALVDTATLAVTTSVSSPTPAGQTFVRPATIAAFTTVPSSASATTLPNRVQGTTSLPSPTVTATAAVSPTTIAATTLVQAPSQTATGVVASSSVGASASVYAPVVSVIDVIQPPSGTIASDSEINSPTISSSAQVETSVIAVSAQVYTQSLVVSETSSTGTIGATSAVYSPDVFAIELFADVVSAVVTVPAPKIIVPPPVAEYIGSGLLTTLVNSGLVSTYEYSERGVT